MLVLAGAGTVLGGVDPPTWPGLELTTAVRVVEEK